MTSIPPSNTARLFIDYRTSNIGVEHTVLLRPAGSGAAAQEAAQETFYNVLQALGPAFFRAQWRVFALRVAEAGSDFTAAGAILPGLQSFVGTNVTSFPPSREALEMRFIGRSPSTGRRVSFSLYGVRSNLDIGSFRLNGGASGDGLLVRNAVAALNNSSGALRCIDGSVPLWYEYVNFQYNSYWERRVRIGA